jgi:hypothetical protein
MPSFLLVKAYPDAAKLRDDRDQTFLHVAARGGHSEVVSLAINKPKVMPFAIRKPMFRGLLNTQAGMAICRSTSRWLQACPALWRP